MTTKGPAAGFATKRPDHPLPEGRRWPPKGQQQVLQQRDQITYNLRVGDGHLRVSSRFCSKKTSSLTYYGQEMATKGSTASVVGQDPDSLPPKGRRWPPKVSSKFCSKETKLPT